MPYGLPKELETPKNESWMEQCVKSVMHRGNGIDKGHAIAICKRQLIDKNGNRSRANVAVINDVLEMNSENRRGR